MRIVAGKWANRRLTSPGRTVRPTAETVRVGWLDALGTELQDARVLDLFAGSGALGLEALSRGARSVDFVENGPAALHSLKANVAALRARTQARIFKRDAIPFVEALDAGAYDVCLLDPPYGSRKLDRVLAAWRAVPFAAVFSAEYAADHETPPRGRTLDFGATRVVILKARTGGRTRGAAVSGGRTAGRRRPPGARGAGETTAR